jgi:hypothetical protein
MFTVQNSQDQGSRFRIIAIPLLMIPSQCDEALPCGQCRRTNRDCPGYVPHLQFHDATQAVSQKYASQVRNGPINSRHPPVPQLCGHVPTSHSDYLATRLVSAMKQSLPPGYRLDSVAGFFTFVPLRLGHSSALDDATECMLALHSESLALTPLWRSTSRAKYVRAIRSLQTCLNDVMKRTTSEVICAILLLGNIEVRELALFGC